MFVATRELTETAPGGVVIRHKAGAVLRSFGRWEYAVRAALLRRGDVVQTADDQDGEELDVDAPVPSPMADGAPYICKQCQGRTFANRQGYRLHLTRIHGGRAD